MKCGNDAAAVGNAATSAVVLGITWIVATDAIIDVIQEVVNLFNGCRRYHVVNPSEKTKCGRANGCHHSRPGRIHCLHRGEGP